MPSLHQSEVRRGARLPFLDWTRGVAVLIMIQCHVFNCYTRMDLRQGGPYVLSQFVGGMAAVLFLFLAGITTAFLMDGLERRQVPAGRRVVGSLRRAGYILVLAYLFRISNWAGALPQAGWTSLLRVDILNCMALTMAALAVVSVWPARARVHIAATAGLAIAAASPLVSLIEWGATPKVLSEYFTPNRSAFALFPWGSYLAFGLSAGTVLRRLEPERVERAMQWALLVGFGLIAGGQYFSNIPYSLYAKADFWTDSPALVIIRVGVTLAILAAAFLWTQFGAGPGWSWVQSLGKTSLMVYWVHVVLVYGRLFESWKKSLSIAQTAAVAVGVTLLMLLLSVLRLRWKERKRQAPRVVAAAAV